ncbi:cinnamoyl-CoA reductase 2-like [Pyrus ussuriensis x Pyrus communis]|uniref:Bifunctional dihydroflavonol 4-reductase/flavanone 4-reductase n=1 Tax=Pyrus ussuriensis x Pyrus communis TaxID=2448454 RepID=A0A5N5I2U8_9ROSA|nr:cinnamoyl-CoA reductase 2-like [Pyrus ussuriensis x Pyrus communis]
MAVEKGRYCVTGAGGFLASWVVKLLLSKDSIVHGTLRDPSNDRHAHLKKLDKASENLKLFKADLLDYESLRTAIQGCDGVFHVASPVPYDPVELIEPAVKGTLNVLKACLEAKVKRVVFVSSAASLVMNPKWSQGQVLDETCWSDKDYCRSTKYARINGLDLVTVCPTLIMGPILQSTVNASTLVLIKLLKEGYESLENNPRMIVDVRDVAEAVVMVYEKPEAEGRYICTAHNIKTTALVEELKSIYPNYSYPKNFVEVEERPRLSSEKLQRLGLSFRPLKETLTDSVESYKEAGLL